MIVPHIPIQMIFEESNLSYKLYADVYNEIMNDYAYVDRSGRIIDPQDVKDSDFEVRTFN